MQSTNRWRLLRGAAVAVATAALASQVHAVRVGGASAPASSALQTAAQQPAAVQADESASLRQGTISALDAAGARVQVQGIWLEAPAGKTVVMRRGAPVGIETLKVGDTIRFTVVPGSADLSALKVIYAP